MTFFGRRSLTRGMIGCFLSHRACWQHCAADLKEPVLGALLQCLFSFYSYSALTTPPVRVFEDDVILADNFTEMLSARLLPDDWDILLLGALGAVHPRAIITSTRPRDPRRAGCAPAARRGVRVRHRAVWKEGWKRHRHPQAAPPVWGRTCPPSQAHPGHASS